MAQQLLQGFGRHTTFDGSCGVGVTQSVHTKAFDSVEKLSVPKLKPLVYRHIRRGERFTMLVLVAGVFQPISRLWQGGKIASLAFSAFTYKPCVVLTILSLANAFSTLFAFQIFAHSY